MGDLAIRFNWIDLIILILLLRTSYVGFTHGFSYEATILLGIIGASFIAIHNYSSMGVFLNEKINLPIGFSNLFSFLILLIATIILLRYVKSFIFKFIKFEALPNIERYGGVLFGFLRGCFLASLILLCLLLIPNEYLRISIRDNSMGGVLFLRIAPACYEYSVRVFPKFKEAERTKAIEEILSKEQSSKKVKSQPKKGTSSRKR